MEYIDQEQIFRSLFSGQYEHLEWQCMKKNEDNVIKTYPHQQTKCLSQD